MSNENLFEALEVEEQRQVQPNPKSKKLLTMALVIGLCVGLDQLTKIVARQKLTSAGTISHFGDLFRWHYSENHGAFLSLGANLPEETRFWIFNVLVTVILIGILWSIIAGPDDRPHTLITYSLVAGGGFSNLLDRFLNDGAVIDFMNVGLGNLRTGIFNLADMAITGGVIMLILFSFPLGGEEKADQDSERG